jgi:hypothetical protein
MHTISFCPLQTSLAAARFIALVRGPHSYPETHLTHQAHPRTEINQLFEISQSTSTNGDKSTLRDQPEHYLDSRIQLQRTSRCVASSRVKSPSTFYVRKKRQLTVRDPTYTTTYEVTYTRIPTTKHEHEHTYDAALRTRDVNLIALPTLLCLRRLGGIAYGCLHTQECGPSV